MNYMRLIKTLSLVLLLASAALAQDVRYNFDSQANFEKYRTYKWVQIKGADQLDQITDGQFKSAIDAEMGKKGMMRTENDSADLYLGYQVALSSEKQVTTFDTGWGYGPGWRGYGYGGGGISTATTSTIPIGQVDLDMYDPGAKKLVWRGTASKTLDPKASPEKRQKNLAKASAKLLKNFPPKKKS
jgi:hypothetical protein